MKSPRRTENKTMAYYAKDRQEGTPMSPKKKIDSPRRPYNTRSSVLNSQDHNQTKQQSKSRIVKPRLKLVNGQVVLDDSVPDNEAEDLTVGMAVIEEDPDRYFTSATYTRRPAASNRWSVKETDLFYEALSMCGTDFSMVASLMPHRNRNQIKGKFKIEERANPHRVSLALSTPKALDAKQFAAKLARALGGSNASDSSNATTTGKR